MAKKSNNKQLEKTQPKTMVLQPSSQFGNAKTSKRSQKEKKKRWQSKNCKKPNFNILITGFNMTISSEKEN